MPQSGLLRLTKELRVRICKYLFASEPINLKLLCLFLNPNDALRNTCKELYKDLEDVYKAEAESRRAKRRTMCERSLRDTHFLLHEVTWPACGRLNLPTRHVELEEPYNPTEVMAKLHEAVSQGSRALCVHGCGSSHRWYDCESKDHINCFGCGRWASLAIHCFFYPYDLPRLAKSHPNLRDVKRTRIGNFI